MVKPFLTEEVIPLICSISNHKNPSCLQPWECQIRTTALLVHQKTCNIVIAAHVLELGLALFALGHHIWAARVKMATFRRVDRARHIALQNYPLALLLYSGLGHRHC